MKYTKYITEESRHGVVSNMDQSVGKDIAKKLGIKDTSIWVKKEIRFIFNGDPEFNGKEKEFINWLAKRYGVNPRFVNLDLSQEGGDITVKIEEH